MLGSAMSATYSDRISGVETSVAIKAPVRVATTANIALSGAQTVDGLALESGDRVLVKDQANPIENGIWVVSTGAWSRATDFNGSRDVAQGTVVYAVGGAAGAYSQFVLTTINPVVGVSDLVFDVNELPENTSATSLGATDAADPDGRESFAPALVTSMQSRKLNGVSLRDLLGRSYTDSNDASVALSGFLAELAPAGIRINDPDGLSVLCEAPWRPQSGMHLQFGANTTIKKGWSGTSSDTDALMARADWATDTDDFLIEGGVWRSASSSQEGRIFAFYGDDWEIRNAQILEFYASQGIVFGGNNVRMSNVKAVTADTSGGTGAFRMVGGDGFRGLGLYGYAGDDIFQFVPITGSTNDRYNQSISNSYYIGCNGVSTSARLLVAVVAGPQNENAMTCRLTDVGWIGCGGKGTNRTVAIENTEGDGTVERQIDRVLVDGCALDGSDEDTSTAQSAYIYATATDGIGRVTFSNSSIIGTPREHGMTIQAPSADVILNNMEIEGQGAAIDVVSGRVVELRDGRLATVDQGGSAAANWVVDITAGSGAVEINQFGKTLIEGVASSKGAFRASSPTCTLNIYGSVEANEAASATGTIGVSHASGSTVFINDLAGTVDSVESGGGNVRRSYRAGNGGELTIASGSVTLTSAYHAIDTESDASTDDLDTVVFPDWAGDGQLFTLRPTSGGRTVVVKNATGNIQCSNAGGDVALDDLYDTFTGIKIGSNLVQIG